jgi:hypothetical protein
MNAREFFAEVHSQPSTGGTVTRGEVVVESQTVTGLRGHIGPDTLPSAGDRLPMWALQ